MRFAFGFMILLIAMAVPHGFDFSQIRNRNILERRAASGDLFAQFALAENIRQKDHSPDALERSRYWFSRAAERNYAPALTAMGDIYKATALKRGDYLQAMLFYEKAAVLGDPAAQYQMGLAIKEKLPARTSDKTAEEWFLLSSQKGYAPASYELGRTYEIKGHYNEAFSAYQAGAKQNDGQSLLSLVDLYTLGHGAPKSRDKAFFYLTRAAEAGLPVAQYNLARAYMTGSFGPKNYFEAGRWLQKASSNGIKGASIQIKDAQKLCLGQKVSAADCLLASHAGDGDVEYIVSGILYRGTDIKQDKRSSQQWLALAALHGNGLAQMQLAVNYLEGHGVAQDLEKAYLWNLVYAKTSRADARNHDYVQKNHDMVTERLKGTVTYPQKLRAWFESRRILNNLQAEQKAAEISEPVAP